MEGVEVQNIWKPLNSLVLRGLFLTSIFLQPLYHITHGIGSIILILPAKTFIAAKEWYQKYQLGWGWKKASKWKDERMELSNKSSIVQWTEERNSPFSLSWPFFPLFLTSLYMHIVIQSHLCHWHSTFYFTFHRDSKHSCGEKMVIFWQVAVDLLNLLLEDCLELTPIMEREGAWATMFLSQLRQDFTHKFLQISTLSEASPFRPICVFMSICGCNICGFNIVKK